MRSHIRLDAVTNWFRSLGWRYHKREELRPLPAERIGWRVVDPDKGEEKSGKFQRRLE